jgi:cysteine desulfuration protein SufE
MRSIGEIQQEIIDNFNLLEEWEDKYQYLIDFSESVESMPEALKTDANLVKECQSRVWLSPYEKDGLIYFYTDSDAPIPKGLVATIAKILNGHSVAEIAKATIDFHIKTDLNLYLSPSRKVGLEGMIRSFTQILQAL